MFNEIVQAKLRKGSGALCELAGGSGRRRMNQAAEIHSNPLIPYFV